MEQSSLEEQLSESDLVENGFRNSDDTYYKVLLRRIPGGDAVGMNVIYRKVAHGAYALESISYVTKTMVEML